MPDVAEIAVHCPECGRVLTDCHSTDPETGEDFHTFQCGGYDCLSLFDASEVLP